MKEQIKELWSKHKWIIIGGGVGAIVVLFVIIRNRSSSSSSTTSQNKNKTVTQDTAMQLDQDINNLETKLDNLGTSTVSNDWSQPATSGLPQSPPTGTLAPSSGPLPAVKGTGGTTELSEEWQNDEYHQQENTWSFRRFTDVFMPINGTDHFDSVGARLN